MKKFAIQQPKDGDMVLFCGHETKRFHFWKATPGGTAHGPDGPVTFKWLVACDSCANLAGGDPSKVAWDELKEWVGDDPVIEVGS